MRFLSALAAGLALTATPAAQANDGFGGLSTPGLTFGQTGVIAMEKKDLFIRGGWRRCSAT